MKNIILEQFNLPYHKSTNQGFLPMVPTILFRNTRAAIYKISKTHTQSILISLTLVVIKALDYFFPCHQHSFENLYSEMIMQLWLNQLSSQVSYGSKLG